MKKTLLFLGLLGLASQAQAQGPWTLVNSPNSNIFGQYNVVDVHTLSPTLMWGVTSERSTSATIPNTFIVTNNSTGAGDQYDFSTVTVTGNATVGNISGISATTAVAAVYPGSTFSGGANYGGEIVKTTNGGQNWVKKTTASQFTGAGTFCNWVHMFNATTGVALGDPANSGGGFEILRTTDGGENWTRLTSGVPSALTNEYGNAGAFFASSSAPGTLWTGLASSDRATSVRTFKTTDFGLTWTASGLIPNIVGAVSQLAFKDNNMEGIAYGLTVVGTSVTALNVAKTTDGGLTWFAITPNNNANGSFFRNSIDAVGSTFYSTGPNYAVAPATPAAGDFGFSTSTDGINWTNLTTSGTSLATPGYFFCMDLIRSPSAPTTTVVGHGGLYTDANGAGGVYKYSRTTLAATRDAALQSALNVYPNPSTSGVFKVDLGSDLKAGAKLTVVDALGRQVAAQTLTASAIGSRTISLDLSGEKTGVYTLQVRTDAGIATQKVVID